MRPVLAAGFVLFLLLAAAALFQGWRAYTGPGPAGEAVTVIIPPGASLTRVGDLLAGAGVVRHPRLMVLAARLADLLGRDRQPRAGEYSFPPRVSLRDALLQMARHQTVTRSLTIPEGLTSARVWEILAAAPDLTGPLGETPPEGALLPETYHYSHGDSRAALARRMQAAMAAAEAALWPPRAPVPPLRSWADAVTLASIVEKETGLAEERPRVAAVFLNRLRLGMPLQSDPTVIYALTGGRSELDRPLNRRDWRFDSPYNTYRVRGLPPGPIANPGRAALEAVLNPVTSNELYFVADGSGGHAFAETLADHNRNVARWRAFRDRAQP